MEISLKVRGTVEKVIKDYVYSWDKIRNLAKMLGIEQKDENITKAKFVSFLVEESKENLELIKQTLEFSKKGLWDQNYYKKAAEIIKPVLEESMKMTLDDKGNVVPLEKLGVKKVINESKKEPEYHIFLSHAHEDIEKASSLAKELELYGFRVFLAHRSIELSAEWVSEIEKQLSTCKIFIAFLTSHFKNSKWCDQESGIAYANNLKIIPLNSDGGTHSYGFLGKYQATSFIFKPSDRTNDENQKFQNDVLKIVNVMMNEYEIVKFVRSSILMRLGNIRSFRETDCLFSQILKLKPFTEDEIRHIIINSSKNYQIYGADSSSAPLNQIMSDYPTVTRGIKDADGLNEKFKKFH